MSQLSNTEDLDTDPSKDGYIWLEQGIRTGVFLLLMGVTALSNLDGGIIPSASLAIQEDMKINSADFGLYGSIDYLGRIVGSLVFAVIINKTNRKYLLVATLLLKSLFLFVSLFTDQFYPNLVARSCMGFSQVYYTIYPPVWCDQYGPKNLQTLWVSLMQLATPVGIVIGFGLNTAIPNWIACYCFEAAILILLACVTFFIPNTYFSNTLELDPTNNLRGIITKKKTKEVAAPPQEKDKPANVEDKPENPPASFSSNLKRILSEPIFWFTGLSNSVCFFGMAVVQFWAGEYLVTVYNVDDFEKFIIFAIICVTGPPVGIIVGGIVGNKAGGYAKKRAIIISLGLIAVSALDASFAHLMDNKWAFAAIMWVYLFFSCAAMPLETGIIINSLAPELKGDGFSVMNFILNLTGNLPASYVFGLIKEATNNIRQTMMICMLYNWFSVLMIGIASIFRLRQPDPVEEVIPKETELPFVPDKNKKEEEKKEEASASNNQV